jgi:hypothetical protein
MSHDLPIKLGPMSVLTVSGICKSKTVLETAVTECVDDTNMLVPITTGTDLL